MSEKTEFEKFLGEIAALSSGSPLNKAMVGTEDDDEELDDDGNPKKKGKGGECDLGKAFTVKLPGGEEVEALDATAILKSLTARHNRVGRTLIKAIGVIQRLGTELGERDKLITGLTERVTKAEAAATAAATPEKATEILTKALTDLGITKDGYDELKKSVEAIAESGRGRKSADIVMPDKGADGKPKLMNPGEFLGKARVALQLGKINGAEAMQIETAINKARSPDEVLVTKVLQATATA
ncbi:MAG TPA: hypothetical protein VNX47_01275 [Nevskia sp.]|jgi:hypothetical protein|nr:hypothetical protein [Nevskia sp.]